MYYNAYQTVSIIGVYLGYKNGYFIFELQNGDIIDFDQINMKILDEFDLNTNQYKNTTFKIEYKEIFDDLDDEEIMIFKLENIDFI